jgi:hypothetical protein
MTDSFEMTWRLLIDRLNPGMTLPNWTVLKGYLGDDMNIVHVDKDEIVIDPPKAKTLQYIKRDEFERIWEIWPDYKAGKLQRQKIREMTYHSKYIFSILHWLEEK